MRILTVEDDRKVAGFIAQGLREEGHAVDIATDGDEATTLAHVNDYDVILLDVVLPKKNGFQVAQELRREGRNTPILMLTSRDGVEDIVRGLDSGADDYLSKPFRFDELLARIRALTRRGGAERLEVLRYGALSMPLSRMAFTICSASVTGTRGSFFPCTTKSGLLMFFTLAIGEILSRNSAIFGSRSSPYSTRRRSRR